MTAKLFVVDMKDSRKKPVELRMPRNFDLESFNPHGISLFTDPRGKKNFNSHSSHTSLDKTIPKRQKSLFPLRLSTAFLVWPRFCGILYVSATLHATLTAQLHNDKMFSSADCHQRLLLLKSLLIRIRNPLMSRRRGNLFVAAASECYKNRAIAK